MSLTVEEELELIALLEAEERFLASEDYYAYVKYTHGQMYQYTRHGEYIATVLGSAIQKRERMKNGEIPLEDQYIMVNVPPQHGKSMHITETFPSFFLGKFPDEGCIEVSYNDRFAEKFGGKNKDKIGQFGEDLFGIRISKDTNAKGEWELTDVSGRKTRGGMISRGIMSGITGSSLGDCIIIDDPIKNREEANSQTIRDKHWDEWRDSISTRIHPGAIVVIIMTRWHEDDLCGRLLNPEHGPVLPWVRVNLPLEADKKHIKEEGNPLNRELGEPLWPERYGIDFIERRKAFPSSYNALFQGRPTSEGGAMLKRDWWQYYDFDPRLKQWDEMAQSWDCTFKDSDGSDYVVGQVWGRIGANKYLLDQWRARADINATMQAIINMTAKWPKARAKYIEDKANGPAIIQLLKARIGGIIAVDPEGGKIARVSAVAPEIEAGNVFLPSGMPWVQDFIEEAAAFPRGANDDQVDAMSQAINKMQYRWVDEPGEQPSDGGFYGPTEIEDLGLTKKNEMRRIR